MNKGFLDFTNFTLHPSLTIVDKKGKVLYNNTISKEEIGLLLSDFQSDELVIIVQDESQMENLKLDFAKGLKITIKSLY